MSKPAETATSVFQSTDILVSRTDKRGIIQSANDTFVKVSAHPWEELEGSPHKIIRHKDMPRGVFWYFWDRLEADEPIGAFVKNLAGDGTNYWVFATVTPLDDGYMSVRIRPQGELLEAAMDLYQKRLAAEAAEECSPEESAQALVREIRALGFHSYRAFMTKSLVAQIGHRDRARDVPHNPSLVHMNAAIEAWDRVYTEVRATIDAFKRFERLPANMRIQAAHLSRDGIPLGVIASNFSALSDQIEILTRAFRTEGAELETKLLDGLFLSCVKQIQNDVLDDCSRVGNSMHGADKRAEIDIMDAQNKRYDRKVRESLAGIVHQVESFMGMFSSIKSLHSGISVTKVMADIEVAKIGIGETGSLTAIVAELAQFLKSERERLHRMMVDVDIVGTEVRRAIDAMSHHSAGRGAGASPKKDDQQKVA